MQLLSPRSLCSGYAYAGLTRRSSRAFQYNPLYLESDIPILRPVPGSV